MLMPFKRAGFDLLLDPKVAAIHSLVSTCKFTIDIRLDLWYGCACYLEETSQTPPAAPPLTLDPSIPCSLLPLFLRLPSFIFNSLQPLLPKTGGWGMPLQGSPLESAVYRLFLRDPVIT